jgi:hypothetical protein
LGLILIVMVPVTLWVLRKQTTRALEYIAIFSAGFAVVYVGIWQIHFSTATHIEPLLPDNGYYQASAEYKAILAAGAQNSPQSFPVMLRDSLKFVGHYSRGVPRLDLAKDDENGSPFFFWPVGARTINYRWETPNGSAYQYLTLVANPIAWGLGLFAVFAAAALLFASLVLPLKQKLRDPLFLGTMLALWICYMVAVSQLDRVMYLYHYFLPLMFSYILVGAVMMEIRLQGNKRMVMSLLCGVLIFAGFQAYRPFAFYEPMTDSAVARRAIFRLWELRCARCANDSPLVQH